MSRYSRAAESQRSLGAREISWPLPVGGLFSQAVRSEVSGVLASLFHNWRSDGISLIMRDGYSAQEGAPRRQRVPFEFGAAPGYVEIMQNRAAFGPTMFIRANGDVMATSISAHVLMADGVSAPFRFDGTNFAFCGFTTDTGKDPADFDGIFSHQDRAYAWDSDELDFYYGDVGAVTGELVRFPLSRLGNIDGTLVVVTSMTVNAAHGMNDVLVLVTSTGWMILYEGLDPGDAADWRLIGRVKVAAPVAETAILPFGSDLWILTVSGVVSVRDSLARGVMALVTSVARPVSDLLVADIKAYRALPGWQMISRQDGEQVIINVPTGAGFKQYMYEPQSQAWATADYPSARWHNLSGRTEFTDPNGYLKRLESGGDDDGAQITATFHTAWVRIGGEKTLAYMIPTIVGAGAMQVTVTVLTDHDATDSDIAQSAQTVTISPDNPGADVALNEVIGIGASGRVFQARFEITGSDVSFENLTVGVL